MEPWQLAVILWSGMLLLIVLGIPIAFAIGSVAVVGSIWLWGGLHGLAVFSESAFYLMNSTSFFAIPLFMLMAELLRHSGVAANIYVVAERWVGRLPGGLGVSTLIMAAILGAMLGVSPASCAIMTSTSMEPMLKRGYDKRLVVGLICAGGAIGVVIPPSVIMIVYATFSGESIGKMFAGGMCIGLAIVLIMIAYVLITSACHPERAPSTTEKYSWKEKIVSIKGIIIPVVIIILILGSIYAGIATATEASGIGAFSVLLITISVRSKGIWKVLKTALLDTSRMFCMVAWIAICAIAFSKVVQFAGVPEWIVKIMSGLPVSKWLILIAMVLIVFVLGFILDPIGIIMMITPVFAPVVLALGIDSLWFAILFIVVLHTSYITPPVGFNLFIMKVMVPPEITTQDIYMGVIPFVGLELLGVALLIIFPPIVTWLPNILYR